MIVLKVMASLGHSFSLADPVFPHLIHRFHTYS